MWGMPAWLLWTSIGSAATMGWNKLQQAGRPPGAPGGPAGRKAPTAIPFPLSGPPPARPRAPGEVAPFDVHMDERTERAVSRCIMEGDPTKLRGFADSLVQPQNYPMGYFPIAAHIMRARAQQVELAGRAAAAQQQAAAARPAPAPQPIAATPAPAPAPKPHVNGAAAQPTIPAPDPTPAPAAPEV